jgi:hypothetical protein
MDDGARRRRAITCSRAIWEMSKVYLSIKPKDVTLDLPMSIGRTLDRLTRDIDYEIRASALKTRAMFNCAHMKRPADTGAEAQKEKVHYPSENIVLALPEVVGSMTSPPPLTPSPSYQVVEQRDDKPYDERLTTVKEYTLGILELIPHLGKPSHMDLEETQTTFEELCRELHGRKFSPADQEHLSVAASNAHSALGNAGMLCSNLPFKF